MSRTNPKKAVAALLPLSIDCGKGSDGPVVVRPMTLGMWAALEHIDSPLVSGATPRNTLELLPSLYLITHDPREIFGGNLLDKAMRWADTQPVGMVEQIRAAAYRQIATLLAVIPEADDNGKAKKKNDGFLAYFAQWAARTYGWDHETIMWRTPMSVIALFHRADALKADRIMPLQVIEEIDECKTAKSDTK